MKKMAQVKKRFGNSITVKCTISSKEDDLIFIHPNSGGTGSNSICKPHAFTNLAVHPRSKEKSVRK